MLKIQLNNSNHRRIEFTEKSSHSQLNFYFLSSLILNFFFNKLFLLFRRKIYRNTFIFKSITFFYSTILIFIIFNRRKFILF